MSKINYNKEIENLDRGIQNCKDKIVKLEIQKEKLREKMSAK